MKLRASQDPYLIHDQCAPPEMHIRRSDIEVLLGTLREHRLVTDLAFPNISKDSDLPVWGEFDVKLKAYLLSIGAEFADVSSFSSRDPTISADQNASTEYHNLPWALLTPSRTNQGRQGIVPSGPLIFSPKTLSSRQIGSTWGNAASGTLNQPLLLIGACV